MKAIVLSAGLGTRLLPATNGLPKALFPFLNVPLIDRRLRALVREGVTQVAVNLHHEGRQIVEHLGETGAEGAAIRFFWEPEILGTAGAVKNAETFFEDEEILAIWNVDAEVPLDLARLAHAHRRDGNLATLLVAPNPDPNRFTPLHADGSALARIGGDGSEPLIFTGVSLLSRSALDRIPAGPCGLVEALWRPVLAEGRERIGIVFDGIRPFDLGTPGDVLAASMAAIETRRDFDPQEGVFDPRAKVLALDPAIVPRGAQRSVFGRASVSPGARVERSVILHGADLRGEAEVSDSLVGAVSLAGDERVEKMFLWPADGGVARISLHDTSQRGFPAV